MLIGVLSIISIFCRAQQTFNSTRAFNEGYEQGIILIALDDLKFLDKNQENNTKTEKNYNQKIKSDIFDTQIKIALKASDINMVILLLKNRDDLEIFNDYSRTHFKLYTKIKNNLIATEIVDHDAVWIRDYGPAFNLNGEQSINILDADYHDSRLDFEIAKKIARINKKRMEKAEELLLTIELQNYLDDLVKKIGDNISIKDKQEIVGEKKELFKDQYEKVNNYLNAYNTLLTVYSSHFRVRNDDDKLPVAIADKIYDVTHFTIDTTNINLDGGNILRSSGCDCFLSSDIISQNQYNQENVTKILKNKYLCNKVIFLNPLPGENIIKHVDMFLLPVDSNTVLLASFNPEYQILKKEWMDKNTDKNVAIEAEIAMRQNYEILKKNGYNVILVPSYLPRYTLSDKKKPYLDLKDSLAVGMLNANILFYPTMLNLLVQQTQKDKKLMQLLIPSYQELDPAIFSNAVNIIKSSFSKSFSSYFSLKTEFIDCTSAAPMQGAIHCLTLSIPGNFTKYTDDFYQKNLIEIKSQMEKLEKQK